MPLERWRWIAHVSYQPGGGEKREHVENEKKKTLERINIANLDITTNRADSVPYLDIFGVAEGALLIIGASLPTLGPMFRVLKYKVTSYASNSNLSRQSGDRSQNQSGTLTSSNWRGKRGHEFDDEEIASSAGMHNSSVDDIPLVATAKPVARYHEDPFKDQRQSVDKPAGY